MPNCNSRHNEPCKNTLPHRDVCWCYSLRGSIFSAATVYNAFALSLPLVVVPPVSDDSKKLMLQTGCNALRDAPVRSINISIFHLFASTACFFVSTGPPRAPPSGKVSTTQTERYNTAFEIRWPTHRSTSTFARGHSTARIYMDGLLMLLYAYPPRPATICSKTYLP
jgi:hypothetical protein